MTTDKKKRKQKTERNKRKFAHAALAVKASLLGGISYTKCSMAFVNRRKLEV